MPRLLRPHVPLETRCRVALRQLGEMWPKEYLQERRRRGESWSFILVHLLIRLAGLLVCDRNELHLDHDPALGERRKVFRNGEHVGYLPDANDYEHLIYRPSAEHRIKTNVRGEHGQHPDRVLIKKARKLERRESAGKAVRAKKSPLAVPKPARPDKRAGWADSRGSGASFRDRMQEKRRAEARRKVLAARRRAIVPRVPREPRNPRYEVTKVAEYLGNIWLLTLSCGHEVSLRRRSRPHKKVLRCPMCERRAKQGIGRPRGSAS